MSKKPTKAQYLDFKKKANDKDKSENYRASFKGVVDKFAKDFEEVGGETEKEVKKVEKGVKKEDAYLDDAIELRLKKSGKSILIALSDFDKAYSWNNAIEQVEIIGDGWRIPNQEELKEIYEVLHLNQKGDFRTYEYWCLLNGHEPAYVSFYDGSTQNEYNHNSYLSHDGADFSTFTYFKNFEFSVRVVKNIEANTQ